MKNAQVQTLHLYVGKQRHAVLLIKDKDVVKRHRYFLFCKENSIDSVKLIYDCCTMLAHSTLLIVLFVTIFSKIIGEESMKLLITVNS
jgi:hypothetical protein